MVPATRIVCWFSFNCSRCSIAPMHHRVLSNLREDSVRFPSWGIGWQRINGVQLTASDRLLCGSRRLSRRLAIDAKRIVLDKVHERRRLAAHDAFNGPRISVLSLIRHIAVANSLGLCIKSQSRWIERETQDRRSFRETDWGKIPNDTNY